MPVEFGGSATIPTMQYGNLQPAFTVTGETFEEAKLTWLREMWRLHRMLGQNLNVSLPDEPAELVGTTLTCWASGTEVVFDPVEHKYSSEDGGDWLSGSTFAHRFTSDFAGEVIARKSAAKHGVKASDLLDMWALNAEVSTTLGTALHAALQLRGSFADLSRATKDGSVEAATTKNPILKPIVEAFFTEERCAETATYEAFVADPVLHHCGQIDRLVINGDGSVVVEDYKTNADIHKSQTVKPPFRGLVESSSLGIYWLQLSFYARILESHGVRVEKLRIHHWTGGSWKSYVNPVIDLSEVI